MRFDLVKASDVEAALAIEHEGFPPDEAATLDKLKQRQALAPELFIGAYDDAHTLSGFVCCTLTSSETLTHDSMSQHDSGAPFVAIHSVVVRKTHRRQGIAVGLLKELLQRVESAGKAKAALLITHDELIPLYAQAGFILKGPSAVVHGSRPWFEMTHTFEMPQQQDLSGVMAALQSTAGKKRDRSEGVLLSSLSPDELTAAGKNALSLFCPRPQCRCLILRPSEARSARRAHEIPPLPADVAVSNDAEQVWLVPSALTFENIGFSKTAPGSTTKYLICADCDLGPLGWIDTGGEDLGQRVEQEAAGQAASRPTQEFLLLAGRLRYA
ncbi:uncharacterized protein L969DRAFT_14525 [Mixia osmundae IAM 14324]|uniref:N-acetyltransferase domain-containing protein n=1 Tax=Mixia osmundae (strain CBS 9802 / IAM 14324 / JCM 22182 / KY 12970) TaxID=764103 RepID=G7EAH1_MIXOS|nr:uncharacterized protein L969DRAFT_14525 [Mixia osmundae IAM 14324]KEI42321.1 hypothetical protein L969DRAFT_14525 [Mixia osmundae IAM 14324]GAA99831.1 hypothetical protein E5Q_06534 [Mixia osmundae IAM 14324]